MKLWNFLFCSILIQCTVFQKVQNMHWVLARWSFAQKLVCNNALMQHTHFWADRKQCSIFNSEKCWCQLPSCVELDLRLKRVKCSCLSTDHTSGPVHDLLLRQWHMCRTWILTTCLLSTNAPVLWHYMNREISESKT